MSYVLGIDLGTSYSAAAIGRDDGSVEIVHLGERAAAIPSLVLLRADGEVLVGEAAERRSLSEPARTAREFKRRLGDPVPLILGGTPYGADALVAIMLREIVARVRSELGEAPAEIVVTHPASYGPYKLEVLGGSIRQAGVDRATLVPEPIAAAIHYASQERVPDGASIAVYDFGGGTFDASVLRKTAAGFEVLGTPVGLERLGGIDFDEAIVRHVLDVVAGSAGMPRLGDAGAMSALARLRDECRRAKEALSSDSDTSIEVLLDDHRSEVRLTRSELEAMIEPRIGETLAALDRAVGDAGIRMDQVERILLVGGTSRIPRIAELVHERTGRPIAVDAHPKHAVALGAARSALGGRSADGHAATPPATRPQPAPVDGPVNSSTSDLRAAANVAPSPTARQTAPANRLGVGARPALVGAVILALAGAGLLALASNPLAGAATASTTPAVHRPTLPPAPTPLAPRATQVTGVAARITGIELVGTRYAVSFEVSGFVPSTAGRHVHFFWSTVSEAEAGAPGHGPWMIYGDASPFTGISPESRPDGATGICILVANVDHTVIAGSGNCLPVP